MIGGEDLRDHAAHRRSDDVSTVDGKVIEDAACVIGHVRERVGGPRDRYSDEELQQFDRQWSAAGVHPVELVGQPRVAIVEPDHVVSGGGDLLAELRPPVHHLGTQAHDQQDRRVRRIAELLEAQVDVAGNRSGTCRHESIMADGGKHGQCTVATTPPAATNSAM